MKKFKELYEAKRPLKTAILDFKIFKEQFNSDYKVTFSAGNVYIEYKDTKANVWGNGDKLKFVIDKNTMKDKTSLQLIKDAIKASVSYKVEQLADVRIINKDS